MPCASCPKSGPHGDGLPHPEKELSDRNWAAYWYSTQCQVDSTGILPRDLIVVRNNALILMVKEQVARSQEGELPLLMMTLLAQRK